MLKKTVRLLNILERIVTAATAAFLVILTIIICYQVFSRYVLSRYFSKANLYWIEEMSGIFMMWIGLLGAAGAVWTDSHMSLDLLVKKIPGPVKKWLKFGIDITITVFSMFLVYQGMILVINTMSADMATLSFPLGVTYLILPASGVLTVIFCSVKAINHLAVSDNNESGKGDIE